MYYNLSQNPVYHKNDNMVNDSSSMSYFNQNMDNTNCFGIWQRQLTLVFGGKWCSEKKK